MAEQSRSWRAPTPGLVSGWKHQFGPGFMKRATSRLTTANTVSPTSRSTLRQRQTLQPGFLNLRAILFASVFALLWCSPCLAAAITFGETTALGYNEILFDQTPPPSPRVRVIKRANTASQSTSTTISTASSTASSTTQSSALPRPFDSSLGNNFTQSSCPAFFQTFLSDSTFHDCIPLSLLLQTSTSFFTVEQSPVLLAETLEATCNVNFTVCSSLMASLARQIQLSSNCGADLQAQNPTVMQAYDGFAAYKAVYQAGCLKDSSTGNYCFSNAVTNASSPTSSYVYFLPLGVSLPSSTKPTCSTCLKNTMAIFADAASNKSQPISPVYSGAADMIDTTCGADFVNTTIAASTSSSAGSRFLFSSSAIIVPMAVAICMILL